MTTRNQVLRKASSYLGLRERGSNVVGFWARQHPSFQGQPWCAAFVVDVLEQCGNTELKAAAAPYYCPSLEAWAKARGRWINSRDALPGDVLIFGTSIGVHTGFLERQRGGSVQTLEGNTSPGNGGSQNNGGGVYRRVRSRSWVRGAIRLDLNASAGPTHAVPIGPRLTTAAVVALQRMLNRDRRHVRYWPTLAVDGELGLQTWRALQAWAGLGARAVDGQPGPVTAAAIARKLRITNTGAVGGNTIRALTRLLNAEIHAGRL